VGSLGRRGLYRVRTEQCALIPAKTQRFAQSQENNISTSRQGNLITKNGKKWQKMAKNLNIFFKVHPK